MLFDIFRQSSTGKFFLQFLDKKFETSLMLLLSLSP